MGSYCAKTVCKSCAFVCHQGHELREETGNFYCACPKETTLCKLFKTNFGLDSLSVECKKEKEDLQYIQFLLEKNFSPTAPNINKKSALNIACEKGKKEILKKFFEFNLDVNYNDHLLNNLLHLTLKKSCSKEMISFLIEKGVGINQLNRMDVSPLMFACKNKNTTVDFLQFLVENKADANIQNSKPKNLLHHFCALEKGNNQVLRYLVSITENIDQPSTYLKYPIQISNNFETICTLIELGSTKINNALFGYFYSEKPEKKGLQYLIDQKADPNFFYEGDHILNCALMNINFPLDLIKFLIEKKAEVKAHPQVIIKIFSNKIFGDEDILFFDDYLDNPYCFLGACENDNLNEKLIKSILDKKADPNDDSLGIDSFTNLSKNKNVSLKYLQLLQEYGANNYQKGF